MKILILTALLIPGLLTADRDWRRNRPVSGFTGLNVRSGINVYLTQGNAEKLTVEGRGVDKNEVRSEVRNGTLELYIDRPGTNWGFNLGNNRSVKAYLTFKQLNTLKASGGADVFSQNDLIFRNLNLEASGGSDVKLALRADELNVWASGGADVKLEGQARRLSADGSGGAYLDARRLTAESGNASSSGGSDVYIHATKELNLKASGGSDIYYYGPARVLAKRESGGSDITRRN